MIKSIKKEIKQLKKQVEQLKEIKKDCQFLGLNFDNLVLKHKKDDYNYTIRELKKLISIEIEERDESTKMIDEYFHSNIEVFGGETESTTLDNYVKERIDKMIKD